MHIIEPNPKLFALIYGQSGSGKTHLAATYCLMYPEKFVLLVDADKGSATLKAKTLKGIKNLIVVDLDAFKDLDTCYQLCKKNAIDEWIKAIPGLAGILTKPFECVIFDTWTEMQWMLMTELRRTNDRLGKGLDFRKNIEIQHWQQMTDLNKNAIMAFKDLPMECLFLAQAGTKEDKETGQIIKGPAVHGKLVGEMPAWFSTVIYTSNTPSGGWKATTLSKMGWPAKVRGTVGKELENPTIKELLS